MKSGEEHSTKTVLISEVFQAFDNSVYPGDDKLTSRSPCCDGDDYDYAIQTFRGKAWQDMGMQDVSRMECSYYFLSDEAFAYFLPAFLIQVIQYYETSNCIPEMIMRSLMDLHAQSHELSDRAIKKFGQFDMQQLSVLRNVIQFVKEYHHEDFLWNEPEEVLIILDLLLEDG